jgi:TolB-like protein/Tfp pilus assembly protein PilF
MHMASLFQELKRRNVVRVSIAYLIASWLLIQIAGVLEPALLLPEWVDRVVTVLLLIGFPIVIIFAWAFELTPDGVKLTKDVDRSQSITQTTGKKLEYFTIAGLSLIVVFFLVREFLPDSEPPVADEPVVAESVLPTSIAVLPFEDYSEKGDQDYFSRGIAEEILNLLAKTPALRVAARTSSFGFAGSELDIREIGGKLNVETVLEGSIRKSGDTIRITAQLINIEDGYHLWSETYDREYKDIFQIQDEIAAAIMSSLKVHLMGEEAPAVAVERAHDMDAYSAYLIGKERFALRTREDIEAARDKFVESIEIDPEYAPARVALAHAWLLLEEEEFGSADKERVDEVVLPNILAAMELAPDLPAATAIRGLHHLRRHRYDAARRDFDRAIELNPNYAPAYLWRSDTFYEQEKYLDMLADEEKAYALDPMSLDISSQLAYDYSAFWRPRDADRIIARMFELHPGHPRAYSTLAANLSAHGRYAEAALLLEQALEEHPGNEMFQHWHARTLVTMGLFEEALEQGKDEVSFWVLLDQGRMEQARELMEKGLAEDHSARWLGAQRGYHLNLVRENGLQPLRTAVMRNLEYYEDEGIPWKEQCRLYLLHDMRLTGVSEGQDVMMEECRKVTEERLKAQYLCPCSWFNLVLFATIDGRTEDAIERAREWLSNGDSFALLHTDPILQLWSDRPEYAEILARNAEQVVRQQQLYQAGVAARDAAAEEIPESGAGAQGGN